MTILRLKRISVIFLIQTLFYMFAFKIFWNFSIFDMSHWKLFLAYINQGNPVSLVFLFLVFSYPFVFVISYLLVSAFNYKIPVVAPLEKIDVRSSVSYINEPEIPAPILNVDVGFVPEYHAERNMYETPLKTSTVDVEKDKEYIKNMLKNLSFEFLENLEYGGFETDYFAIADRLVFFGAYFNNENATIVEDCDDQVCSWLDNGNIISSPLQKLGILKRTFSNQAAEVLEDVKVDFQGVLFLSTTPENLEEIVSKAETFGLKIICMDNLPEMSDAVIDENIEVKENEDGYFKRFVMSVATLIDPAFEYDDSADEYLNEMEDDDE